MPDCESEGLSATGPRFNILRVIKKVARRGTACASNSLRIRIFFVILLFEWFPGSIATAWDNYRKLINQHCIIALWQSKRTFSSP